jgi:hypothetical protein
VQVADALRAAAKAEGFLDAMHLHLFEQNSVLKGEQEKRLAKYNPYWSTELDAVTTTRPRPPASRWVANASPTATSPAARTTIPRGNAPP